MVTKFYVLLKTNYKPALIGRVARHSLKVAWGPDVSFGQLLALAFRLLLVQAAVNHVVDRYTVLKPHAVDLWVLDVHCGHGQGGP